MSSHTQAEEAKDFLKEHPAVVLATVDQNNNPHAAVVYLTVDGSSFKFLTKTGTKKADNLKHNNHAMIVAYEAETQTTVQLEGEVSEITDHAAVNEVFTGMLNASMETGGTTVPPIAKLKAGDYIAFELKPKEIRMASFGKAKSGERKDLVKATRPEA